MRVHLLFGFLGSGKTTLARRLLEERGRDLPTALIVNEFGDVGVDGDILRGSNVDMIELASGCVCCQLRGSLMLAVEELRAKARIERIIVEATGIAQPGELVDTLADPTLGGHLEFGPLVTVVDSARFARLESMLGEFYLAQIEDADVVILNKVDLASARELSAVERAVREINGRASVLFAQRCDVDPGLILDGGASSLLARSRRSGAPAHGDPRGHRDDAHSDHPHEAVRAESFVVDSSADVGGAGVRAFFGSLPDSVWRAKGFVRIDGVDSLVQYALGELEIEPAATPTHRNLVFIGRDLDRDAIAGRFAAMALGAAEHR